MLPDQKEKKSQRIAEIFKLLQCRRKDESVIVNRSKLAKRFNVTVKTIQRDLDELPFYFPGYDTEYRNNSYELLITGVNGTQRKFYLEDEQVLRMLNAAKLLAGFDSSPVYRQLVDNLKLLESQMGEALPVLQSRSFADGLRAMPWPLRRVDEAVYKAVYTSWQNKLELQISYSNASGVQTERTVRPMLLINDRGELYCLAFCLLRNDYRIFALSRITAPLVTAEQFVPVDPAELDGYFDRDFGAFYNRDSTPWQVRLRFSPDAARAVRETEWPEGFETTECADGGVEMSFASAHRFEVVNWVLSHGGDVTVLEPPELRRQVAEQAEKVLRNNGNCR